MLDTWVDEQLEEHLERDAAATGTLDGLDWGTIDGVLDSPGWRDRLVSQSTTVRRGLAILGLLLGTAALVGVQGLRSDLDPTGWVSFILAGWVLVIVGAGGSLLALRSQAARPMVAWPWIPVCWAFVLVWSAIGPWPGMTGVPPAMHFVCFSATSTMVLFASFWIGLLERGPRPIPWRYGLTAAAAGCVAFVAQSLFCPGVDYVHLVVGHGGASFVGGSVAFVAAWFAHGILSRRAGSTA